MTYESKGLSHEKIADFNYVLIMSKDSKIANKKEIRFSDLEDLIQISHGDPYVPLKNDSGGEFDASGARMNKVIYLFERGSQFDLLRDNRETFMWVSPIPQELLDSNNLVQRRCIDSQTLYRDVLIWRKDYRLSSLDRQFIKELRASEKEILEMSEKY